MIAKKVQIKDAQAEFHRLLELVKQGEEIIIMDNNEPVAQLIAIPAHKKAGLASSNSGEKWTSEDFDIKLEED
jgi:prevent-host-death family protein